MYQTTKAGTNSVTRGRVWGTRETRTNPPTAAASASRVWGNREKQWMKALWRIWRFRRSNRARVGKAQSARQPASRASRKMKALSARVRPEGSICPSMYQSAARKPNTAMNSRVRPVPCFRLSLKACQKGRKM